MGEKIPFTHIFPIPPNISLSSTSKHTECAVSPGATRRQDTEKVLRHGAFRKQEAQDLHSQWFPDL